MSDTGQRQGSADWIRSSPGNSGGHGFTNHRNPWFHPNSLEASSDPEIQRKIREGRAESKRDSQLLGQWALQGFTSSIQDNE